MWMSKQAFFVPSAYPEVRAISGELFLALALLRKPPAMNVREQAIESLLEKERKENQRLWDKAGAIRLDAGFYSPMISPGSREALIQEEIQRLHPNLDPNDPARMPPKPPSNLQLLWRDLATLIKLYVPRSR
jgi:hypothetical protein